MGKGFLSLLLLLLLWDHRAEGIDMPQAVMEKVGIFKQQVEERIRKVNSDRENWLGDCVYHACLDYFKGPGECMNTYGQPEQNSCSRDVKDCSPMKVFNDFSVVRTSPGVDPLNLIKKHDVRVADILEDIGTFQGLEADNVFQNASEMQAGEFPSWRYLGTKSGVFISWPGSPRKKTVDEYAEECRRYDPRIRPWFVPALGTGKALVILLDEQDTEHGRILVGNILSTLSYLDMVTIIPFTYEVEEEGSMDDFRLVIPSEYHPTHMPKIRNKKAIGLKTAFNLCFSQLRNSSLDSLDKIVVYISGAEARPANEKKVLGSVESLQDPNDPISVLSFSLHRSSGEQNASNYSFAKSLSCEHNGIWTPVQDLKHPNIQGYLSFLALPIEHAQGNSTFVHVSDAYEDSSGLGLVVTISSPVFETCGANSFKTLRGVVGVDKQLGLVEDAGILQEYSKFRFPNPNNVPLKNIPDIQCHLQRIREETGTICPSRGPPCRDDCRTGTTPLKFKGDVLCNYGDEGRSEDDVDSNVCCTEEENNQVCRTTKGKGNFLMTILISTILPVVFAGVLIVIIVREYMIQKKKKSSAIIGRGSTGYVTKAIYKGQPVAMKVFEKYSVEASRELTCLQKIPEDQHVVRLIHHEETMTNDGTIKKLTLYLELMDMNLKDFVQHPTHSKNLSFGVLLKIFGDIVKGLKHLHKYGIVHRDLKPENVLVKLEGPDILIKICDMGHSKHYLQSSSLSAVRGSRGYIPPEIMAKAYISQHENLHFSPASDVYSLGVLMCYCIMGDNAFVSESQMMQPALRELIQCCNLTNPEERPSLDTVQTALVHFQTCSWAGELLWPQ